MSSERAQDLVRGWQKFPRASNAQLPYPSLSVGDKLTLVDDFKTIVTNVARLKEPVRANRDACLVVIYGSDLGKRHSLDHPVTHIGRSSTCDICLEQESVSRNHARVETRAEAVIIFDERSTNGTYVNDTPVDQRMLVDGDLVQIGRTIFKFLSGGNVENSYHEEIYRLTTTDGLTQVHNKRYFLDTLERELSRSRRHQRPLSLVLFDIDRFKQVNDTHGHLAGDAVLKQLAALVKDKIRREDVFARYGGEEFAVILPEIDAKGAAGVCEKIRALVDNTPFHFEGEAIPVTISAGYAMLAPDDDSLSFVGRADEKLYQAKEEGRNCFRG